MGVCQVCQLTSEEFHYGGMCCRACAAFFRRYVHSQRGWIRCTCASAERTSRTCRQCRMTKCLEAEVLPHREPSSLSHLNKGTTWSFFPSLTDTYRIISRECSKVHETAAQWSIYSSMRRRLYGEKSEKLNFYQLSCLIEKDGQIMCQMVESLFPQLEELKKSDKDALFSNFMCKFFLMESAFEVIAFRKPHEYSQWNEQNRTLVCNFYGGAMPKEKRIREKDILRIFWPFWTFYFDQIMIPIYERRNDLMESMAHLLLILFEPAYINISEECASLCRVLRNMILRELKGYHIDNNVPDERFFDALDNLNLLEKADKKFQEEIQLCEFYNVRLHEDFRRIAVAERL